MRLSESFPDLSLRAGFAKVRRVPRESPKMFRLTPLCPALLCLALTLTPLWADEPNLATTGAGTGKAGAATRLVLAQRGYDQAMDTGDPLLMLAAIRLARGVTKRPATAWVRLTETAPPADQPRGRDGAADPGGAQALAILQGLAADDPDLQDLVYDLDAQLPPGRMAVATVASATLGGGGRDDWRLPLSGAVAAEIAVIGDGDSALGLAVLDDAGATICALPPSTGPSLCRFTPARNGFFSVTVTNSGQVWNSYRLIGN